ncbi:hypothetical protein C6Y45_01975 [Alkalicoccus saliphilus]|uniref:Uncharacterized protein n=1 Tax=Alkalicoccus saliphilus TaxID=200989 RepID=A0A2T4U9V7_9BACI|nr:hypothetical protein C6Y45_01975 [Alkalicoccus saliphilus]
MYSESLWQVKTDNTGKGMDFRAGQLNVSRPSRASPPIPRRAFSGKTEKAEEIFVYIERR